MPVAGESSAACRSSAVATVDCRFVMPCAARAWLRAGSNGDFYRASMADVLRRWYPQLPNRGPIRWISKASYLLARDRWFESVFLQRRALCEPDFVDEAPTESRTKASGTK